MALESTRTIAELKEECENRNLTVIPTGKNGKYLKEDFIKALRADYLVERFGELEDVPFPLRFMLTMDCPMLCKRYAAIKKQDVQISLWKNDGKYAAEEKIDGCMTYDTPVLLSDGTTKPIGEIVENKLAVEVMSFDETTQTLVPRKVTNWFNHGMKKPEQWARKIFVHDSASHAQARSCYFTGNHVFFKTHDEYSDDFTGTWEMLDPSLNKNETQANNSCLVRVYRQNELADKQNKRYCVQDAGNGYSLVKVSCSGIHAFNETNVNETVTKDGAIAYDIEVDGCHNFIADGFIVHNSRSILIYDAERHEFDFFSRHNSVSDFLPISYKDTILVHGNYRGDTSFVLDCEVISTNANVTTKKTCTSQLNSTSAILALDPVQSREIQKNNPLLFVVFDCLYNGVDIRSLPWKDRHVHAEKLAKALSDAGFMCKINPYVLENKKEFYENLIKQGSEGCVFKRTDAPYSSTTSRTDDMVKLKRTVACDLASDIDAWVSGFTEATKGKANENYIGGLIFSCKVKLKNGETVIREIGRVAGIPQDLRVEMTDYDANGNPKLKQSYYGRVATISGQDISGVNKRLTHCVLKAWRYDKDPSGCEVLSEEELDKLIM